MNGELKAKEHFRCGYAALIGEPNVGKSTLMNALLGQKLSIVTPKPQTTRHKVLGILSTAESQIIFLDTPGIITPKYLLQEVMMEYASSAIKDADVVLFMIDATKQQPDSADSDARAFAKLKDLHKPAFLIINKVDVIAKPNLLPMIASYSKAFPFKEIFPISALRNDGTPGLIAAIVQHLPQHEPFYQLDIVSERNERFFVAEIIREKIFLATKEEVPYSATVDVVEFKEREKGKTFISAEIYVERDSQKGILIGRKGEMLKRIGAAARKDVETFLGGPVFLELHVRVKKEWREDKSLLAKLGYRAE